MATVSEGDLNVSIYYLHQLDYCQSIKHDFDKNVSIGMNANCFRQNLNWRKY